MSETALEARLPASHVSPGHHARRSHRKAKKKKQMGEKSLIVKLEDVDETTEMCEYEPKRVARAEGGEGTRGSLCATKRAV